MNDPTLDALYGIALYLEKDRPDMAAELRIAARQLIEAHGINRLLADIIYDDLRHEGTLQ